MACDNPQIRKLQSLFELNLLSDKDRANFENHLLECDTCYEEFFYMSPVIKTIMEDPDYFLPVLKTKKKKNILTQIINFSTLKSNLLLNRLSVIFPRKAWVVTPLVVVFILIFVSSGIKIINKFTKSNKIYSNIAWIEPEPYTYFMLKSQIELSQSKKLFAQGMQFYEEKKYPEAIRMLYKACITDPENKEGYYFLGLCHLLAQNTDSAIVYLHKSQAIDKGDFAEKLHWYLGNAFLLDNDGDKAKKEFNELIKLNGDFKQRAEGMIEKINKVK